ncbi:MAG: DUF4328 domain-containing protein [Myxococcota bacterium]
MSAPEQLDRRSLAAKVGLWSVALSDAAAVPAGLVYAAYLQSLDPNAVVEELEFVPSEMAYAVIGLAQLVALIVAAIFFIRWFYLVHGNLSSLSDEPPTHHTRWTIWGFIIPFLNLIRPHQLMREVWSITSNAWEREPSRVVGVARPVDRVNLWWGFFLGTSLLGNAVARAGVRASSAQETVYATWATVAVDAVDLAAALVAVSLVRSVTELQSPLLGHAPRGPVA